MTLECAYASDSRHSEWPLQQLAVEAVEEDREACQLEQEEQALIHQLDVRARRHMNASLNPYEIPSSHTQRRWWRRS